MLAQDGRQLFDEFRDVAWPATRLAALQLRDHDVQTSLHDSAQVGQTGLDLIGFVPPGPDLGYRPLAEALADSSGQLRLLSRGTGRGGYRTPARLVADAWLPDVVIGLGPGSTAITQAGPLRSERVEAAQGGQAGARDDEAEQGHTSRSQHPDHPEHDPWPDPREREGR